MDGGRALRASRTKRIFVHAGARARAPARMSRLDVRHVPSISARAFHFCLKKGKKKKRILRLHLVDRSSLIRLDDLEFLIRRLARDLGVLARLTRGNAEVIANVSGYYLLRERWHHRERERVRATAGNPIKAPNAS